MLWIIPLALGVAGLILLAVLAERVRREVAPTMIVVDRFGREHRVALTEALARLRAQTAQARPKPSRD